MWTPPPRELSESEQAEAARLQKERDAIQGELSAVSREYSKAYTAASEGKDPESAEVKEALAAARKRFSEGSAPLRAKLKGVTDPLEELIPSPKRETFVWLYERR